MSVVKAELDITQVVAATAQLLNLNNQQIQSLKSIAEATILYNDAGDETGVMLKGLLNPFQQIQIQLKRNGQQYDVLKTSIIETNRAQRALLETSQALASRDNGSAVGRLIQFNKLSVESKATFEKIRTSIEKLNTAVVTPDIIKDFFDQIKQGNIPRATGDLAKLRDELVRLNAIRIPAKSTFTGKNILNEVEKTLPINRDELSAAQRNTVTSALQRIKEQIRSNPLATPDVKGILGEIQKNPIKLFDNKTDQAVADQLRRILATYEQIINAAARKKAIDDKSLNATNKTAAELEAQSRLSAALGKSVLPARPSGDVGTQGRIVVLTRQIGQLAAQAKLTEAELKMMFEAVSKGDFGNVDTRYARIIKKIIDLNGLVEQDIKRMNDKVFTDKGFKPPTGPRLVAPDGPSEISIRRLNQFTGLLQRAAASAQFFAIYKGFSFIESQLTGATTAARQFDVSLSLVRTISQEAQVSFGKLGTELQKISAEKGLNLNEVAKAAFEATSSQVVQGENVFKFLREAGDLARTTDSTIAESTTLLSAVINAYGLRAEQAGEISAKLFKTIDLGNIKVGELSRSFGTVAFIASDLGVSLDEVLGILALLTRAGVSTDEAMTLLNNVMQKLTKPTEETKVLFDELGAANGRALVKARGFSQVLQEIINLSKTGKISITEFFPEARAERGIAALSSRSPDQDIKAIGQNSQQAFENAIAIRGETAADKVNKFINALESQAVIDFGREINNVFASFIPAGDNAKDLDKAVASLIGQIRNGIGVVAGLTVGFTTAKIAITAVAVAVELQSAIQNRRNLAILAGTVAQQANNAATVQGVAATGALATAQRSALGLVALGGPIPILLSIVATVGSAILAYKTLKAVQGEVFNQDTNDLLTDIDNRRRARPVEDIKRQVDEQKVAFEQSGRTLRTFLAEPLRESNSRLRDATAESRRWGEALKASVSTTLDGIKEQLSTVRGELDRLRSEARNIPLSNKNFRARAEESLFNLQSQTANDPQFIQLAQQQIAKLKQQSAALFQQGTPEGAAEGRQNFERILDLQAQIQQRQLKIQQESTGFALFDPNVLKFEQNSIIALKETYERSYAQIIKLRQQALREQEAALESKRKETEAQIARFENFSIKNNDGTIRPEFRDPFGKIDTTKVKSALDAIVEPLKKNLGADVAKRTDFARLIDERKKALDTEIKEINVNEQLRKGQIQLNNLIDQQAKNFDLAKDAATKYNTTLSGVINTAKQLASTLKDVSVNAPGAVDQQRLSNDQRGLNRIGRGAINLRSELGFDKSVDPTKFNELSAKFEEVSNRLNNIENFQITDAKGNKTLDQARVADTLKQLEQFRTQFNTELNSQLSANKLGGLNSGDLLVGKTRLAEFDSIITRIREGFNEAALQKDQADKLLQNNVRLAEEISKTFGIASSNLAVLNGQIGALKPLDQQLNLEATSRLLDVIIAKLQNVQVPNGGVVPERKAYGGPIGQDNNLVWAQPGEIMLNKGAATNFFSQAVQMNNAGRIPQSFSTVSSDTFNVNINESRTPTQTVSEMKRQFTRLKRRGLL